MLLETLQKMFFSLKKNQKQLGWGTLLRHYRKGGENVSGLVISHPVLDHLFLTPLFLWWPLNWASLPRHCYPSPPFWAFCSSPSSGSPFYSGNPPHILQDPHNLQNPSPSVKFSFLYGDSLGPRLLCGTTQYFKCQE